MPDSIFNKLWDAYYLSLELVDLHKGKVIPKVDEATDELIWLHCEGGFMGYIEKMTGGRCSLAASMAFDLSEEETRLDHAIGVFKSLGAVIPD